MHSWGSLRAVGHLPQGALAWDTHLLKILTKLTALTSQHTPATQSLPCAQTGSNELQKRCVEQQLLHAKSGKGTLGPA